MSAPSCTTGCARRSRCTSGRLSLNPNLAMAWALSAIAYAYLGDADEAERRNNRYKKLSPLDPHAFFFDRVHHHRPAEARL